MERMRMPQREVQREEICQQMCPVETRTGSMYRGEILIQALNEMS
jgi:hypothetical protein